MWIRYTPMRSNPTKRGEWTPEFAAPIDGADFWPTRDEPLDEYELSLIERHRQYAEDLHYAES